LYSEKPFLTSPRLEAVLFNENAHHTVIKNLTFTVKSPEELKSPTRKSTPEG
jgi:hypothetical protein